MLFVKLLTGSLKQTLSTSTGPVRSMSVELAHSYFNRFSSYAEMIREAKSLARRSILIDCGPNHVDLSNLQNVERVYLIEKEARQGLNNLSLIEFKSESDAAFLANQAYHRDGHLPVSLNILKHSSNNQHIVPASTQLDRKQLPFKVTKVRISHKQELRQKFRNYTELLMRNSMSLVDFKLRIITLVNLERILCAGMFKEYELMPFGSSVIQLGCDMGDLDLVVTRKENHDKLVTKILSGFKESDKMGPARRPQLVHLDKRLYNETRDHVRVRNYMNWFDYVLREYMPLIDSYGVLFIRYARVPIIKFTSLVTMVDCDLSFNFGLDIRQEEVMSTSYSGIIMSQILYSICRNNNLITAAFIYLRIFGKLTSITSKEINIGMTNFQFLSLILFYLQQVTLKRTTQSTPEQSIESIERKSNLEEYKIEFCRHKNDRPIVPPFKNLLNSSFSTPLDGETRLLFSDEQLEKLLPELVTGFFKFYSDIDFLKGALNLFEGKIEGKLDNSCIYVVNPLDQTQNVCHNVTQHGMKNFTHHLKEALVSFEKGEKTPLSLIKQLLEDYANKTVTSNKPGAKTRANMLELTEDIAQDIFR